MKFQLFSRNPSKSDEELAEAFRKDGDMEILGELYNRHLALTMGLCMKYLKDVTQSEDAAMEIFEVIVKRLPNHKVENFKAWLYRVASNHCLDILRKKKRVSEKELEMQHMYFEQSTRHDSGYFSEELDETEIRLQAMEACIEELKSDQRKSVELFYLEKKSYEEVAEVLNISWSKTRSFIQNGRRNLKKCMEQKHETARDK